MFAVVCCLLLPLPAHALSNLALKALCGEAPKAGGSAEEAAAKRKAGDEAFELRKDPARAREAIAAYEASLAADPGQIETRVKLSRAYYLVADGYDRLDEKDEAMVEGFEKGMTHAALALGQVNPAFKRKVCTNAAIPETVATLDKASVAPVYWFSTHLGKYGLAKDLLEVLANKDFIFAVMDQLRRLAPAFYYFAPDRYLGGYYTKVPFPKGDLPLAFTHFRASMKGNANYFATYVLVAEMYASRVQGLIDPRAERCVVGAPKIADGAPAPKFHPCRAFFEKLLKTVIDGKAEVIAEIAAEQAVEQRKAVNLLKEMDTFFPSLGE
jgi:hypothetical protein